MCGRCRAQVTYSDHLLTVLPSGALLSRAVYSAILESEEGRLGIETPSKAKASHAVNGDAAVHVAKTTTTTEVVTKTTRGGSRKRQRTTAGTDSKASEDVPATEGGASAAASPQVVKKITTVTKFVTRSLQAFSNGIDMEIDLASERCNITNRTGKALNLGGWILESDVGTQVWVRVAQRLRAGYALLCLC